MRSSSSIWFAFLVALCVVIRPSPGLGADDPKSAGVRGGHSDAEACGSGPSAAGSICGDGLVSGDEECDDANGVNGDGCDGFCHLEGACCLPTGLCVDNTIEEVCERADAVGGIWGSYQGNGVTCGSVSCPVCGDGVQEGAEECDDGNTVGRDGCSSWCDLEGACCIGGTLGCQDNVVEELCLGVFQGDGTACDGVVCPGCGDGVVNFNEECDDGNTANGDGCDEFCRFEGPCCFPIGVCVDGTYEDDCISFGGAYHGDQMRCADVVCTVCGDGVQEGAEACDDANNTNGDGCDEYCRLEGPCCFSTGDCVENTWRENCDAYGGFYSGDGLDCADVTCAVCGDGVQEGGEACDDGNTANGDGCDQFCRLEGACCFPSGPCVDNTWREVCETYYGRFQGGGTACADVTCAVCGDGVQGAGEQCDDGNTLDGDGCDELCRLEGACCFGTKGICVDHAWRENCESAGGTYHGGGSICATIDCQP